MTRQYWLMKSEPDVYGIADLERDGTAEWEGVRNYQARNIMRDEMNNGDWVLFYHSNAKPPGVAGVAKVCREGYPDFTAWDPTAKYFDEKTDPDEPRWFMVDLEFVEKFADVVPLNELKETPGLEDMMVIRKGARLSVQPCDKQHFQIIRKLGRDRR